MNLIRIGETIINMDNVQLVERLITEHQNTTIVWFMGADEPDDNNPIEYNDDEAEALWERLCAAERSGAGPG